MVSLLYGKGLANEFISTMSLLFALPFSVVTYSKTDFLNLEPLLVTPSICNSVKSGVISFSMVRMMVFISLPVFLLLFMMAISTSSEKRSIRLYPFDNDVPPLKTDSSIYLLFDKRLNTNVIQ